MLTIAGVNGEAWHSLQGNAGSAAIIARQRRGSTVKREPVLKKLALYKLIKPHPALLPPPVPTC